MPGESNLKIRFADLFNVPLKKFIVFRKLVLQLQVSCFINILRNYNDCTTIFNTYYHLRYFVPKASPGTTIRLSSNTRLSSDRRLFEISPELGNHTLRKSRT